jgi:hypothetical protein
MLTLTRNRIKSAQDALDFAWMVTHSMDEGQRPIDLKNLERLGAMVPKGGAEEVLRLVKEAKKGGVPQTL